MSDRRPWRWGVASPHPRATEAAAAVLEAGGSAVDAVIAAAAVLTVVYPHNCSVGGDLIALVRRAGEPPKAVFGVGRSARATDAEALRRSFGERLPAHGPHTINVPGVVSGWQSLHELGGGLPFTRLLQPAIELASGGAAVTPSLAAALNALDSAGPGVDEIFGPAGNRLGVGEVFYQPRLAETLAQVAASPDAYYRGELARRLVAGLQAAGSPITWEDFSSHRAVVEDAAATEAGSLAPRLFTAGLPSQGVFFAVLAQMTSRLLDDGYQLTGRDAVLLARAFREISGLRDELLGDPARAPGPDTVRRRVEEIDLFRPGAGGSGDVRVEAGAAPPSGDTVAVVTADESGNSVSLLQSVFHSFGSRVTDPATGVLFHNRQSMFTLRRGAPGELGPGLMPPHTLCPAMVDGTDGAPSLVLATMGGRGQPQILAQTLLQLAGGASASEALSAPRFVVGSTEDGGSELIATVEQDVPPDAVASLADGGFDVRIVPPLTEELGHSQLLCLEEDGVFDAAADPRSDGTARLGEPSRRPPR